MPQGTTVQNFFTVDEVKKVIDQMTRVKLNVLHWHLVDDQGWRIECKTLPLLPPTELLLLLTLQEVLTCFWSYVKI